MYQEHVIEFIPGTGIVLDGVVDASQGTGNGPYTWTKPSNAQLIDRHTGCGGGGKGGNGGVGTSGATGGGGGASGSHILDAPVETLPGTTLTITLGSAGVTGSVNGGSTTVTWSANPPIYASSITLRGGGGGVNGAAGTSIAGAAGGNTPDVAGGVGGNNTGSNGGAGTAVNGFTPGYRTFTGFSGSGSGGVGAASAGNGGATAVSNLFGFYGFRGPSLASGLYSGGGSTPAAYFGASGAVRNANASGSADANPSVGYGVGGNGGAGAYSGTAIGADGRPGYYRITYYTPAAMPPEWVTSIWAASTRTLTGFGTLAADTATAVWAAATRTLSAFGFTVAPTAEQNASATRTELAMELGRIDATISSRNATTPPTAASIADAVWAAATRTLSAFGFTVAPTAEQNATATRSELANELGRIDATISSRNATTPPTAASIADAVWDEASASHQAAGSMGALIDSIGEASDPWSTVVPGDYAAGTAGALFGKLAIGEPEDPVVPVPAPPNDPQFCTVYLYSESITGQKVAGIGVTFELEDYPSSGNRQLLNRAYRAETDANGLLSIALVRTDELTPSGRTYRIRSSQFGIALDGVAIETDVLDLATLIHPA